MQDQSEFMNTNGNPCFENYSFKCHKLEFKLGTAILGGVCDRNSRATCSHLSDYNSVNFQTFNLKFYLQTFENIYFPEMQKNFFFQICIAVFTLNAFIIFLYFLYYAVWIVVYVFQRYFFRFVEKLLLFSCLTVIEKIYMCAELIHCLVYFLHITYQYISYYCIAEYTGGL